MRLLYYIYGENTNQTKGKNKMAEAKMSKIAESLVGALGNLIPYLTVKSSDNLCSSVRITGSYDLQNTWKNGILQNSQYFHFFICPAKDKKFYSEGDEVEVTLTQAGYAFAKQKKFRKYTGTPEQAIKKVKQWISVYPAQ